MIIELDKKFQECFSSFKNYDFLTKNVNANVEQRVEIEDLFVYCLCFNKNEVLKVCWEMLDFPIRNALFSFKIIHGFSEIAKTQQKFQLQRKLLALSEEWEMMAVQVIENCFNKNQEMSKKLLLLPIYPVLIEIYERKLKNTDLPTTSNGVEQRMHSSRTENNPTEEQRIQNNNERKKLNESTIGFASAVESKRFIGTRCCHEKVTEIWKNPYKQQNKQGKVTKTRFFQSPIAKFWMNIVSQFFLSFFFAQFNYSNNHNIISLLYL